MHIPDEDMKYLDQLSVDHYFILAYVTCCGRRGGLLEAGQ